MSNGNQSPQPSISPADIERAMRNAIKPLETKMTRVSDEVESLRRNISTIETAKLEGKIESMQEVKPDLVMLQEELKSQSEEEMESIQEKYDEAMNELVEGFVDDVQADTALIDNIKEDFEDLESVKKDMINDVDDLSKAQNFYYRIRNTRLKTNRMDIQNNLSNFLEHREQTSNFIDGLKVDFENSEPYVINVPFWVVGTVDERGNKKLKIYSPQEIDKDYNQFSPSRSDPYREHLRPLNSGFEDLKTTIMVSDEEVEKAKEHSVLLKDKIQNVFSNLNFLEREDYTDDSENGDSIFVKKMKEFIKNVGED